jgi:hypothetical protein
VKAHFAWWHPAIPFRPPRISFYFDRHHRLTSAQYRHEMTPPIERRSVLGIWWRSSSLVAARPRVAVGPLVQEESREPIRGANAVKLPRTGHDSARVFLLVSGSPFDSVRSCQTHCPCLGVKGSQVQILSSRPTPGPLTLDKNTRSAGLIHL